MKKIIIGLLLLISLLIISNSNKNLLEIDLLKNNKPCIYTNHTNDIVITILDNIVGITNPTNAMLWFTKIKINTNTNTIKTNSE